MSTGAAWNNAAGKFQQYTVADRYDESGNPIYNGDTTSYTWLPDDPVEQQGPASPQTAVDGPPPLDFSDDDSGGYEDIFDGGDTEAWDASSDQQNGQHGNGGSQNGSYDPTGSPMDGGSDYGDNGYDENDLEFWDDFWEPGGGKPPKNYGGGGGGNQPGGTDYTPPPSNYAGGPSYGGIDQTQQDDHWGASYGGLGQDPYLKALQEFSQPFKQFFNQMQFNNF